MRPKNSHFMWSFQLSLSSKTPPRYLNCETCLIREPFIVMKKRVRTSDNLGAVPKSIASVLATLKNKLFSWSPRPTDARFLFSFSLMTEAYFAEYNDTVLSAYITQHYTTASGRSFTCRINKIGPRICLIVSDILSEIKK